MSFLHMATWFVFGFIVAAIVLYGPMMRKSIKMNKDAAKDFEKACARKDELLKALKDFSTLAEDHSKLGEEHLKLGEDHIGLLREFMEHQKRYGALQSDHVALQKAYIEVRQKLAPEDKEGTA